MGQYDVFGTDTIGQAIAQGHEQVPSVPCQGRSGQPISRPSGAVFANTATEAMSIGKPSEPATIASGLVIPSPGSMPADACGSEEETASAFDDVAERYRPCGRRAYHYVKAKLNRDPVCRDMVVLAGEKQFGDVIDVGCGRGQLGIALLEASLARSVLGLDCQIMHLEQARAAASGLAYRAETTDLSLVQSMPQSDTVLLIDVLYQLDTLTQHGLLQAAAQSARERIIIRTLDPERGLRSALTLGIERLLRRISPHAGAHVNALPVTQLISVLSARGFTVAATPCWRGTPFSNVLLIARRILSAEDSSRMLVDEGLPAVH